MSYLNLHNFEEEVLAKKQECIDFIECELNEGNIHLTEVAMEENVSVLHCGDIDVTVENMKKFLPTFLDVCELTITISNIEEMMSIVDYDEFMEIREDIYLENHTQCHQCCEMINYDSPNYVKEDEHGFLCLDCLDSRIDGRKDYIEEYFMNNPDTANNVFKARELEAIGFKLYENEYGETEFRRGYHCGDNADPKHFFQKLEERNDVIFHIKSIDPFTTVFQVYIRPKTLDSGFIFFAREDEIDVKLEDYANVLNFAIIEKPLDDEDYFESSFDGEKMEDVICELFDVNGREFVEDVEEMYFKSTLVDAGVRLLFKYENKYIMFTFDVKYDDVSENEIYFNDIIYFEEK